MMCNGIEKKLLVWEKTIEAEFGIYRIGFYGNSHGRPVIKRRI